MEKEKEREFDPELLKVNNALQGCSPSSVTSFATQNEESLLSLTTSLKSSIDILTSEAWNDSISTKIADSVTKINELLKNCTDPAHSILSKVGTATTSLLSYLKSYDVTLKKLNEYVAEHNSAVDALSSIKQYNETKTTDADGNEKTTKTETDEWTNQIQKINNYKGLIQTKDEELAKWKANCDEYIAMIKGLLSPIGSESSNAALAMTVGITTVWENIDATDIDPKYNSGDYTIEGTETRDANGKLLSRTYTIRDKDGNIIRTGSITYDDEGKPTVKSYIERYDKPTPIVTIKEKAPAGDPTGEALALLDPTVEAATTEATEAITYSADGTEFKSESEVKKTFDGGGHAEMEYETTGKVVDGELLPEERNGEGDVTTSEGDHFDAETHETWNDEGERTVHDTEVELTGDDGMTVKEHKIDIDENRDGVPDEGMKSSVAVETENIPTEKQEKVATTILENAGSDTSLTVKQNGEFSAEVVVSDDGKTSIETTMTGVERTNSVETNTPANQNNDMGYSTANTSVQNEDETVGRIVRTKSFIDGKTQERREVPIFETEVALGDKGNSGSMTVTSRQQHKTETEYSLEYDPKTHMVTETTAEYPVDASGERGEATSERTHQVRYEVNTVEVRNETGSVTITFNPNTDAGSRYLAETVASMVSDENSGAVAYDYAYNIEYPQQGPPIVRIPDYGIEIELKGGQSVSPGGEIYSWDQDGQPIEAE